MNRFALRPRPTALVIGGGPEAAAAALELQGPFEVLVLEGAGAGPRRGLIPPEAAEPDALRQDHRLRELGVDLDREFAELARELPPSTRHQRRWLPDTWRLFELCRRLGLDPQVTPKMPDPRRLLEQAVRRGARCLRGARVRRLTVDGGLATAAITVQGLRTVLLPASLLVLAAGGRATPEILRRSGIPCGPPRRAPPARRLWARREGLDREVPTPFRVEGRGFALAPCLPPRRLGLLVLPESCREEEEEEGGGPRGLRGEEAAGLAAEILRRLGAHREELRVEEETEDAVPGGAGLPLTAGEARSLHPAALPANLYLADATLLPEPLGRDALLTLLALARRVARAARTELRTELRSE